MDYICEAASPLGKLTLASDGARLTGLWIEGQKHFGATLSNTRMAEDLPLFVEVRDWLSEYFGGGDPAVHFPLAPKGSEFREAVWDILRETRRGELITYGQIAKRISASRGSRKTSPRAVGGAVGHNLISIIIPCHRVVGSGGSLTGYAAGTDKKLYLLKLEGAIQ